MRTSELSISQRNLSRFLPLLLASLLCVSGDATAQHTIGRWAVGMRGGINTFLTDFNKSLIGPGFDITGRYGITRNFSLAGTGGYEELKTHIDPNTLGLPYDYVKLHAFPVTLTGLYHAFPGNTLSPYFSAGAGVMFYQRLDWQGLGLPDNSLNATLIIPVSVGVEYFLSNTLSINMELGYRILDDKTETVENGGFDSFGTLKGGVHLYLGSSDEDDDDNDGLTNGDEGRAGTDRLGPDTDGDGLKDGEEVNVYGSSPLETDTDGDGIPDGEEIYLWKSSPTLADTDKDGLTDFDEKVRGTNPINADSDGDVLLDGEEVAAGSDPMKIDTDADGLSDYLELKTHLTVVTLADSDQDSLNDGMEVTVTKSNPLNPDTDAGGVLDGLEFLMGTNPLDPMDDLAGTGMEVEPGEPMVISGLTFAPASATIGKGSETALENAFITLVLLGDANVDIVGHTDNVGSSADNERLSLERAEAVLAWFVKQGIVAERLRAIGLGGRNPIAPNDTEEGRAANRRIELIVRQ